MDIGFLNFGNQQLVLEEANIYGIFEKYHQMSWYIELFPKGEDNYMIFNALPFENIVTPRGLNQMQVQVKNRQLDLDEHKVLVGDQEYVLQELMLTFGNWDPTTGSIVVKGEGKIERGYPQRVTDCTFEAVCRFDGLRLFETSQEEVETFISQNLKADRQQLDLHFENAPLGLECVIGGRF
ncbi:MAG: hypothetical protein MUC97_15525 [Bernardetiaceae bacterium]|jgi:hypothetical protein|nr:hypothetical protein [Bernardetiaceae bacterium]